MSTPSAGPRSPGLGQKRPQETPITEVESSSSMKKATSSSDAALQALQRQLAGKDASIASLQEQLSTLKQQEVYCPKYSSDRQEKYKRELSQHSISIAAKDKGINSLKSSDSEQESMINLLQLELGQLRHQFAALRDSSGAAPTTEQYQTLAKERDTLKTEISAVQDKLKESQSLFENLLESYVALERDAKKAQETLVTLGHEHGKLKDSHTSEIQKSRLSHSRAAELQLENKTLMSRVEELKQKVMATTFEKLELVERAESLDKELFKLRKERDSVIASGGEQRGSVELNIELDDLIQGQETRQTIRETNQRTYSHFVGQQNPGEEHVETMTDINERRLRKGKDSGEFGREIEIGFVVDLISDGGCGMCTGGILVL